MKLSNQTLRYFYKCIRSVNIKIEFYFPTLMILKTVVFAKILHEFVSHFKQISSFDDEEICLHDYVMKSSFQ